MFGFPNRVDGLVLSGGSWLATLPRSNIQTRPLGKVARTTDTAMTSCVLNMDQGRSREVRIVSVIAHNLSLAGKYRLRGSSDPTFATVAYDSGWKDVWPAVYPIGTLPWGSDSWWGRKYSKDERAGYNPTLVAVLPKPYILQYWRLEFDDTSNAAGFVQIGRIFIGPAWQPATNASFGLSNAYETKTDVQSTKGGAEIFNVQKAIRMTRFSLDWMSEDEGLSRAFELDRQAGIDKEIMWVEDPDDTVHAIRRQFLARLNSLSPLANPYPSITTKSYEMKEIA